MIEEKYKSVAELSENAIEGVKRTGMKVVELRDYAVKLLMPLKGNTNHVGIMYAGSIFALAEITGGILPAVSMDVSRFVPIVKEISIRYLKPVRADATLEAEIGPEEAKRIQDAAEKNGKADFKLELEIKDAEGAVAAVAKGVWQVRKMENLF